MKKIVMPLLALILLLSMSCAACRANTDAQPGESISTTEPANASTQGMTEAPDTTPAEHDWGMGAEDFEDNEKKTEPTDTEPAETEPTGTEPIETKPIETEPSGTEPIETEPSGTEPIETKSTETEPTETNPSETEPTDTEPDWGMGGEDF